MASDIWTEKNVRGGLYDPRPGVSADPDDLSMVGLDFDDDLGGLKKGPRVQRPRLHPAWIWTALAIPLLLIAINPAYGFGFVCGATFCVTGMLNWRA